MILEYIPLLCKGAVITLASFFLAAFMSLCIGTFLGSISCRYLAWKKISRLVQCYTFITKGIPAYVQILIGYFIVPYILGIQIPGFLAATLSLALCSSGYVTEIIRSGIDAVSFGQWQAAQVLGYCLPATCKRIIAPQAFSIILPALFGEGEQLLKSTSLLATIGVTELTRSGMNIISRELNPIPIYLIIAGMYLLFSALLLVIRNYCKRELAYGSR